MSDRYESWIRGKIKEHEPGCEEYGAVMRLAEACAVLGEHGGGTVFGMAMGTAVVPNREQLYGEALAVLKQWLPRLDLGAVNQLAEYAARHRLPLDLTAQREQLAAQRRDAIVEAIGGPPPELTEFERAVLENPEDREACLVLADWLQSQGDPRGELITYQIRGETDEVAAQAARDHLERHRERLLGPLASDGLTWRRGYIHAARFSFPEDDGKLAEAVELLLRHPSGRFLAELSLGLDGYPSENTLDGVVEAIASAGAPALRELTIGDFEFPDECEISWYEAGDLSRVWAAVPRLQKLAIQGGSFTLGELDLPELERLEVRTGSLSRDSAAAIARIRAPKLHSLEIWYGDPNYGAEATLSDVEPLLARTDLRLVRLGLCNAAFTDEICAAIARSPLLPGLRVLDLSKGTMSDDGATALLAHRAQLAHLAELDLSRNYLSESSCEALATLCDHVICDDQNDADDDARYPSVGE